MTTRTPSKLGAAKAALAGAGLALLLLLGASGATARPAAADGTIWVGYGDESDFGGDPLSANGVVAFDPAGAPVLRYAELAAAHGLLHVDECYALNAAPGGDVWLYYYDDVPLVRLRDRRLAGVWRPAKDAPIIGAHAVAVAGARALFVGGYRHPGRLFVAALDAPGGLAFEEVQAVDARSGPLGHELWGQAFGRGSVLYLRTRTDLLAIDVAALPER